MNLFYAKSMKFHQLVIYPTNFILILHKIWNSLKFLNKLNKIMKRIIIKVI